MDRPTKKIVVVGGGAAGWITAGMIAAEHCAEPGSGIEVVLIESPDVEIIGVGEGTWPTMRMTLSRLGVRESDFIRECGASFKQGSKFLRWVTGADGDYYYHPFTLPHDYARTNLAAGWVRGEGMEAFADAVCPQGHLCESGLAPKQAATPEYAYVVNYGYHLDAGKFAKFLQAHCTAALGVTHIRDHITRINADDNGDIASLSGKESGEIAGDLFVDCTGFSSLLLRKHYGVKFISQQNILFIDRALAVQRPYPDAGAPIASATLSTAQSAGWIWDIGLPERQGVGHVYSSAHVSDAGAEEALALYLNALPGGKGGSFSPRKISIAPGHCEKFWHRNCVAVGMSAGFLEPLEASALVMIELSAQMLSEHLPASRGTMDSVARRYNEKFLYHWARVIDFLKLHYALSRRADSDFWKDNRREETAPESLLEALMIWKNRIPWHQDFDRVDEIFSSASYQYVLYGMGFGAHQVLTGRQSGRSEREAELFEEAARRKRQLAAGLPANRELIGAILAQGLPPRIGAPKVARNQM